MGGASVSSASSGLAIRLDGAIARDLESQARISGEATVVIVKKAVRRYLESRQAVPPAPTKAEIKRIAARVRKSDAKDDWQDYADWSE